MKRKARKIWILVIALVLVLAAGGVVYATLKNPFSGVEVKYKNEQPGFERFSYTLKGGYNSYEDVVSEIENLAKTYKDNIDGCSEAYIAETKQEYYALYGQLKEEIAKFPKSATYSLDKREKLYSELDYWEDEYYIEGQKGNAKMLYEKALDIIDKYENGVLTLNEAYKQMDDLQYPPRDYTKTDASSEEYVPKQDYVSEPFPDEM